VASQHLRQVEGTRKDVNPCARLGLVFSQPVQKRCMRLNQCNRHLMIHPHDLGASSAASCQLLELPVPD
jgi:hypothetical protein